MTVEMTLIFGGIACIIGISGYIGGRQSAAKVDGVKWGKFEANQAHILSELQTIKAIISQNAKDTKAELENMKRDTKESFEREHMRIDNLERRVSVLEANNS